VEEEDGRPSAVDGVGDVSCAGCDRWHNCVVFNE
jgi:hypothetical protein